MGKRLRTEFVICLLSVCPHPRSDPPAAPALRGSQAGSPWPRYPGEGSLGVHSRRKFLSIPELRPAGRQDGGNGQGRPVGAPHPWGCLSQLFPENGWFVWWGRGEQGLQPCPVGSLCHGSASLGADALGGGNTRGFGSCLFPRTVFLPPCI